MEHTAAYAIICSSVAWGSVAQPASSNLATTVLDSALNSGGSLPLCCSLPHATSRGLLAQPPCRHAAAHHMRPDYVRAGEVHKEVHGCCLHVLRSTHDGAVSCSCVDACCIRQVTLQMAWHSPCLDYFACWHCKSVHDSASRSSHLLDGALDAVHEDGPRVEVLWGRAVKGGTDVDLVPAVRLHALPRLQLQQSSLSLAEDCHTRQQQAGIATMSWQHPIATTCTYVSCVGLSLSQRECFLTLYASANGQRPELCHCWHPSRPVA